MSETCHKCEASVGNCTCPELDISIGEGELGSCLLKAVEIITGERQDQYGNPEDSFELIGDYWTTYLNSLQKDLPINAKDVVHMMILFKLARCSGQQEKRDNYIDMCGYASIVADRLMEDK